MPLFVLSADQEHTKLVLASHQMPNVSNAQQEHTVQAMAIQRWKIALSVNLDSMEQP